ncbi:MAG: methylated-DNA--[protein]-cysteine S-methyltransferase [Porticoccaceae bacterium]
MRTVIHCQIGDISIELDDDNRLVNVDFVADKPTKTISHSPPASSPVVRQLEEYFRGKRQNFDVGYRFKGTDFQRAVWQQIAKIPFGHTITYGDIARAIGKPNASRAVGAACGQNPIGIIVPCHRVVGSTGKLTGYAGGLWRKQWLLDFESSAVAGKR